MYIQSRIKLINALKLDTNPWHTIRAKMRDESTCHWEPSFHGAERGRRIIYVGRSHWPFALRRHFGTRSERHTRPTAAEHSFGSCSGRAFFLPDVVGWANFLTPIYGQNNGIFNTFRFENIREHGVKFENNRGYLNRKDKFENIRGFRGFCADPDVGIPHNKYTISRMKHLQGAISTGERSRSK